MDWNRILSCISWEDFLSHPSWVCGLKLIKDIYTIRTIISHTLRGCVDWNLIPYHFRVQYRVTPFVGVWIETPHCLHHHHKESVTPFVGVWIETYKNEQGFICYSVTPFVGVWIETELLPTMRSLLQSHPSWVCGLKQTGDSSNADVSSHTLRGCVDWTWLPACYTLSK